MCLLTPLLPQDRDGLVQEIASEKVRPRDPRKYVFNVPLPVGVYRVRITATINNAMVIISTFSREARSKCKGDGE